MSGVSGVGGSPHRLRMWPPGGIAAPMLIFLLAASVRSLLLYLSQHQLSAEAFLGSCPDTTNYVNCAKAILTGWSDQERGIFAFGPGYPAWLALHFHLFGVQPWTVLIMQTLLSSLSCVGVYLLANRLTGSRTIAVLAGVLSSVCITSSVLSCFLLSDTLYVFLFVAALVLVTEGFYRRRISLLIIAGLLFGASVLVRSIGQFWILALILFVLVLTTKRMHGPTRASSRRFVVKGLLVLCGGILLFQVGWMARNRVVHGLWTIAFTGAGGPATVAALSLHPDDEWNFRVTMEQWDKDYRDLHHDSVCTPEQNYVWLQQKAWKTFSDCPSCVIRAYLNLTWKNLNDVDYLSDLLLPQSKGVTEGIRNYIRIHRLNMLSFFGSLLGLTVLLLTGRFRLWLILTIIYGYFVAMIGAFPWQGSRYFYPGHIAADILTAVGLYFVWKLGSGVVSSLWAARDKFD